jgi:hypothetical protein
MKRTINKITWVILGLTPVLFWFHIYRASTTEYDENWFHFFVAILISFLTIGLLVFNRKDFESYKKQKELIQIFSLVFASPLTVGLIIFYQMTF